jgi:ribonuclease T2
MQRAVGYAALVGGTLMISYLARVALFGVLAITLWTGPVSAQGRRQDEPGKFDFYLLSLSWSPSFCDAGSTRAQEQPECGPRAYSFVVHGLWPQYERGFPRTCQVPPPRLPRELASSMLDLMPAPRLVYHEWDEHGTCSGLSAAAYFKTVREARGLVNIPPQYSDLSSALTVNPEDVRKEFIKVNPKLTAGAISIDCDKQRLREVRICLSKDLGFRDCAEVTRQTCRRDEIVMPPVRGGRH